MPNYNVVLPRTITKKDGDVVTEVEQWRRKGKITKYGLNVARNAKSASSTKQNPVQTLDRANAVESALVCECGSKRLRYIGDGVLECMECSELKEF